MPPAPALRVDHARVTGAGPATRARLEQVLAAATPAATGVAESALLLVQQLRLKTPLSATHDRAAAALVEQLRAVRRAPGAGDLYLEHPDEAELLLVAAALTGGRPHPLLHSHLPDAAQPLTRWRRHLLPDTARLPTLLVRLAEAGLAAWLARFEPGELVAAQARLLPPAAGTQAKPASPTVPPAVVAALAAARQLDPALPAEARHLLAAALVAIQHPHLLPLPATQTALTVAEDAPAALIPSNPVLRQTLASVQTSPSAPSATQHITNLNPAQPNIEAPPVSARLLSASGAPQPLPETALPVTIPQDPAETPPPAFALPARQAGFPSDHAGLFFLVPAFTALGLYGDFSQPRVGLAGLSPFGLLWWLGRHWRGRAFLADPLAPWLRHAAGAAPREAVTRWFQPPEPVPPRRWLVAQARHLRTRLREALGSRDPLAILLAQPGEIRAEANDLIICFPLSGHPLALRLAGLDRDPGFLPAAGCSIRFDFPC